MWTRLRTPRWPSHQDRVVAELPSPGGKEPHLDAKSCRSSLAGTLIGYPWSSYFNNRIVNYCFDLEPIQPCGHILTWPTVSCCSAAYCCQAHPLYYTKCVSSSSSNKVTLAGPGLPSQTEENCAIMGKPSHTLPCHTTLAEPQVLSKVMLTTTISYMLTWQLCSIHKYILICPRNSKWTFQL